MLFQRPKEDLRFDADDPQYLDVRDLTAARKWYEEKFGWPVTHVEPEPDLAVVFDLGDGQTNLCLSRGEGKSPVARFSTPDDLDDVHRVLESRGIVVGPVESASDGRRHFRFRDLEENVLEVFERSRTGKRGWAWPRMLSGYRGGAVVLGLMAIAFGCMMLRKAISIGDWTSSVIPLVIGVLAFVVGVRLLVASKTGRVPRWVKRMIDSP
jgi:catechol 2,3-dioxygenase-like lactoylglutathione lyase family enzyme